MDPERCDTTKGSLEIVQVPPLRSALVSLSAVRQWSPDAAHSEGGFHLSGVIQSY